MRVYQLHREQYLPISIEAAWDFFSTAKNLQKITPTDVSFQILTDLKDEPVYTGQIIDYIVKPMLNIPMRWTTEITGVEPPHRFMDRQLRGPYSLWEHTHSFESVAGGVKMTDDVQYAIPLGVLGTLAHALFVKKKLNDIFRFRELTLNDYFGIYKRP
jgi:ligand-binding SRPBCC domain-containing protein